MNSLLWLALLFFPPNRLDRAAEPAASDCDQPREYGLQSIQFDVFPPVAWCCGTGGWAHCNAGGGSTCPGGADGEVQWNDMGSCGGDPDWTWEDVLNFMTLDDSVILLTEDDDTELVITLHADMVPANPPTQDYTQDNYYIDGGDGQRNIARFGLLNDGEADEEPRTFIYGSLNLEPSPDPPTIAGGGGDSAGTIYYDEDVSAPCWTDDFVTWSCALSDTSDLPGSIRDFVWAAPSLLPLEHVSNAIPPLERDAGTNVDVLVLQYDGDADECSGGTFVVPGDIDASGTVTFTASWYSGTATTGNIIWDIRHSNGQAEGASWDTALTTETAAADATQGTVDLITKTVWTETVSNTSWAAGDVVNFELCRDANNGSDTLVGDASLIAFRIEVPLA